MATSKLREALLSVVLFVALVWAVSLVFVPLLSVHLIFYLVIFLVLWVILETARRVLGGRFVIGALLAAFMALILSAVVATSLGWSIIPLFIIANPVFYFMVRDHIADRPSVIPLFLALFYLPMLLPATF